METKIDTKTLLPINYLFGNIENINYDNILIIGKQNIRAICFRLEDDISKRELNNHWEIQLKREAEKQFPHPTLMTEFTNNVKAEKEMITQRKLVLTHLQSIENQAPNKPEISFKRHPKMYPIGTPVMVYLEEGRFKRSPLLKGWQFGIITESNEVNVEVFLHNQFIELGVAVERYLISHDLDSILMMKIEDLRLVQKMLSDPIDDEFEKIWWKFDRVKDYSKIINEFREDEYIIGELDSIYEKLIRHLSAHDYRIKVIEELRAQLVK